MDITERTPFGQRLFQARTWANLSQEQVAKEIGIAQSTLASAEIYGKRSGYTPQLAAIYNVPATYLATGKLAPGEKLPWDDGQNAEGSRDIHALERPQVKHEALSEDEVDLILAWRKCRREQRDMFRLLVSQVIKKAKAA